MATTTTVILKNHSKKHYRGGDMSRPEGYRTISIAPGGTAETSEENAKRIIREHKRGDFEIVREHVVGG